MTLWPRETCFLLLQRASFEGLAARLMWKLQLRVPAPQLPEGASQQWGLAPTQAGTQRPHADKVGGASWEELE